MNELQRYLVEEAVEDYEEGRVTRRVAKAGYVGLAVDLLSREGGTAKHDFDASPGILGKAAPARHVQDFKSGLAYASSLPSARADRVGMTGFCFGGAVTWRVATSVPDLRAAVPFYGVPVQEGDVLGIGAAVLAIYGGLDDRIQPNTPANPAGVGKHRQNLNKNVYPHAGHAFP